MVGQELALISPRKIWHFVVQHWARKGTFAAVGLPWGKEHWTSSWDLWTGSVVEGLQGSLGPAAQQSLAGAAALSSSGNSLPCPAFQLLHTRVQGISCSLKVAQAKHKTQTKVLPIALTEHEKLLLKYGGLFRLFFSTDALKASSECFLSVSMAILYI